MRNHVTYLASLLRHGKHEKHAIFPSCALYINKQFILSFDLDFEMDIPVLKAYSKDRGLLMHILVEFDAMRSPCVITDNTHFLVKLENGKATYGVEYELIVKVLNRKK
jgi:hypothetical protein